MNRLKLSKLSNFQVHQAMSSRLSDQHSRTPESRMCWVDSEAQWDSSCWQIVDGGGEEQHQKLGWSVLRGSCRVPVLADTGTSLHRVCIQSSPEHPVNGARRVKLPCPQPCGSLATKRHLPIGRRVRVKSVHCMVTSVFGSKCLEVSRDTSDSEMPITKTDCVVRHRRY